jgi:hypothetical protein
MTSEPRSQEINQSRKHKKPPPKVFHEDPKYLEIESGSDIPIRAVLYVEVGDMAPEQVTLLLAALNDQYKNAKGGIHYIIPVRDGKIGPDIVFEEEFLIIVEKMCEIKNGKIVLKNGAQETQIVRKQI